MPTEQVYKPCTMLHIHFAHGMPGSVTQEQVTFK